jgi:putative RNA 2'-phosphotransferase
MGRKLIYALRHDPASMLLEMDKHGWVELEEILSKSQLEMGELETIISKDDKGRFALDTEKGRLRAAQGHSINIDLDLAPVWPPDKLYHGTVEKYIPWIEKEGLKKMSRNHVHLSPDIETAEKVASRRDTENVILEIDAKTMAQKGFDFFVSSNGVWLTDRVPPEFISNLS